MSLTQEVGNTNLENSVQIIQKLKKYLVGACTSILETSNDQFSSVLEEKEVADILSKFATSTEINILWIGILSSGESKCTCKIEKKY